MKPTAEGSAQGGTPTRRPAPVSPCPAPHKEESVVTKACKCRILCEKGGEEQDFTRLLSVDLERTHRKVTTVQVGRGADHVHIHHFTPLKPSDTTNSKKCGFEATEGHFGSS